MRREATRRQPVGPELGSRQGLIERSLQRPRTRAGSSEPCAALCKGGQRPPRRPSSEVDGPPEDPITRRNLRLAGGGTLGGRVAARVPRPATRHARSPRPAAALRHARVPVCLARLQQIPAPNSSAPCLCCASPRGGAVLLPDSVLLLSRPELRLARAGAQRGADPNPRIRAPGRNLNYRPVLHAPLRPGRRPPLGLPVSRSIILSTDVANAA